MGAPAAGKFAYNAQTVTDQKEKEPGRNLAQWDGGEANGPRIATCPGLLHPEETGGTSTWDHLNTECQKKKEDPGLAGP